MRQNEYLWSCVNYPNARKRKHAESDYNLSSPRMYPINEILDCHNAIRKEVTDIAKEARQIQLTRDFTQLSTFYSRLEFVADVCIYHSIAEDQILFPAVDMPVSFVEVHAVEKEQFNNFRILIKSYSFFKLFNGTERKHKNTVYCSSLLCAGPGAVVPLESLLSILDEAPDFLCVAFAELFRILTNNSSIAKA